MPNNIPHIQPIQHIRRPLFDGMRAVRGLWFDLDLIGENEARRRILAHWRPGARLHRIGGGYLLELPQALHRRCADLDGLPLCDVGGVLSSAPLRADEQTHSPHGSIWLIRGAQAELITPAPANRVDPSAWIDLNHIPVRLPLQLPRHQHSVTIDAPPPTRDVRDILGKSIPKPSAESQDFQRDAAALRDGKPGKRSGSRNPLDTVSLGVLGLVGGWLDGLFGRMGAGSAPASGPAPSALSPWAQRLQEAVARLAMFSRVSKLLGRRQAAYLQHMLDLFEKGDWQDALRHAVPLDAVHKDLNKPSRQAFGVPRPRSALNVTRPGGVASSIGVSDELQSHMRAIYRRTFERLDREGRVDEAVFVLAELLASGSEAVTYLERKERLRDAAELAETLELSTEIAVRLWWLAGEPQRAARLAQLGNAFGDAVRLLERTQSAEAAGLRVLWAQHLAARGELTEAADALWPLPDQRAAALAWLLQAEQSGGVLGARALVRKLALAPDSFADSEAAILALLAAEGEDGAQQRARLAGELIAQSPHSHASKRLAAALLRQVLPERLAGMNQLEEREVNRLVDVGSGGLMKADLPAVRFPELTPVQALNARAEPVVARLDEHGLQTLLDVVRLPDGQYLAALGESGVLRINRHGKTLDHYPIPAHRLVLAHSGQHALALAERDSSYRISRLDLLARKASDWTSLPLRFWSDEYDGVTWNVVMQNRLAALDTTQERLTLTWQVADFPGELVAYAEEGLRQVVVIGTPEGFEQWRYLLPQRRLNQRDCLAAPEKNDWKSLIHASSDEPVGLQLIPREEGTSLLVRQVARAAYFSIVLGKISAEPNVGIHGNWLLVVSEDGSEACCRVADLKDGRIAAEFRMPRADQARVRMHGEHILMFDRAGRLIDLDCRSGLVRTLSLG